MAEIRYGLIGAGYFGAALGRALATIPGARLEMVFDPEHGAAFAAASGARLAPDAQTLCADPKVDAVIVASPNWVHVAPVLDAAAHGKHIFCEKPLALNYDDCLRMVRAAADAGVLLMAGHVMHFMHGVRRTKELIAEGVLGELLFCRAARNGWEEPKPEITWKKRRDLSGGHLYHHIHELDLIQSLMGPARRVTMSGGNVAHHGPAFGDEDDMLLLMLEFGDNRFATMEYGSAFRWPEHVVMIEGTQGALRIDLQDVRVELRAPGRAERFALHRSAAEDADRTAQYRASVTGGGIVHGNPAQTPPLWLRGIIDDELRYFHALVQGAEPVAEFAALTDGTAAMAAIATADALTRSLREDRKVDVAEITGGGMAQQGGQQAG